MKDINAKDPEIIKLHEFLLLKKDLFSKELEEKTKKFVENIHYRFAWDGEDLYKYTSKIRLLEEIIGILNSETLKDFTVEKLLNYLTRRVLNTTLMSRSSGQLHSLVSLWDKEVVVEVIELIRLRG